MNTKKKGSAGEREICRILTGEGYSAHRNDQWGVGGYNNPDVAAEGLERFHLEIKRTERLNLGAAMEQAERDAAGKVPVVVSRKNRKPWLVTMHLSDWLALLRGGGDDDG